jgi:hypothetical protein
MKTAIKWGLIAGAVAAVLNICVSTLFGFCGPFMSLLAGAAAGFFTGQAPGLPSKGAAAREGTIAGGVAGAVGIVGQLLGGVGAVTLLQVSGTAPIFGSMPTAASPVGEQVIFYASALGTGLCFGIFGLVLSAAAGAGVAYLAGPSTPALAPAAPPNAA